MHAPGHATAACDTSPEVKTVGTKKKLKQITKASALVSGIIANKDGRKDYGISRKEAVALAYALSCGMYFGARYVFEDDVPEVDDAEELAAAAITTVYEDYPEHRAHALATIKDTEDDANTLAEILELLQNDN